MISGSFRGKEISYAPARRDFLWEAGGGFASLALLDLLQRDGFFPSAQATETDSKPDYLLAPKQTHFKACADRKSVV